MKKGSLILTLLFLLTGCLQQELKIVLNSDGSGEYHIKKEMGKELSQIIGLVPEDMIEQIQKEPMKTQELGGGVKLTNDKGYKDPDDPSKFIEEKIYTFSNLGEALPVLEDLIDMGPRYRYENGKFIIFRDREVEEWTQFSDDKRMKDAYFNLTIVLPQKPLSTNGTVNGNTVSWNFDAEFLKKYKEMEIGQNIIKATLPAAAVKTDIRPRLISSSNTKTNLTHKKKTTEHKPLESFSAYIPVVGNKYSNSTDAKLSVYFDVKNIDVPFSYKDLKVNKMLIEGEEVKAKLTSDSSGFFAENKKGFPLSLSFPAKNPWISNIDLIKATLSVGKILKSNAITIVINTDSVPAIISKDSSPDKIALTDFNFKSFIFGNPHLELVSSYEPNMIKSFYLDTNYGLRYKTTHFNHYKLKDKKYYDGDKIKFNEENFPDQNAYVYEIGFTKIPKPPFNLVTEIIEKQSFEPLTLSLENLGVSN